MLFSLLEMVNLLLILWVFSRDNDNTWGFLVLLVLLFKTRNHIHDLKNFGSLKTVDR